MEIMPLLKYKTMVSSSLLLLVWLANSLFLKMHFIFSIYYVSAVRNYDFAAVVVYNKITTHNEWKHQSL